MKLSESKLALAKVINENGGWPERALWAVQDNCIAFFLGGKPEYKSGDRCWYSNCLDGACVGTITCDEKVTNWHQCVLSREEYYQAYPKDYADGWIEWKGGQCPVDIAAVVDVRQLDSHEYTARAVNFHWLLRSGSVSVAAYRLHKPDVKPEFCESVMRSIPEPESHEKLSPEAIEDAKFALMSESIEESKRKPTIEQLAKDYSNAKDYADRLQKEADTAKDKSEEIKVALINAGEDIGIVISIAKDGNELEYKIGEKWFLVSDLKAAGWTDLQLSDYQSR